MALTFRDEQDDPLTSAEQDDNIRTLRDMIQFLSDNPSPGVGITNITADGSQLTIHLSNGTTRGPFTIPAANFRYREDWAASTAYLIGDFFRIAEVGLYTVMEAHTSGLTFDPEDAQSVLAVPFFAPSQGWLVVEMSESEGVAVLDLNLSDKFILDVIDDCEIQVPINGYAGQPFALRIVIAAGSAGAAVSFSPSYLGPAPSVLLGEGDETVMGGMVLDTDPELTDPGTTAIINALKEIAA